VLTEGRCRYPHLVQGKVVELTDGKMTVQRKDGQLRTAVLEQAQQQWQQAQLSEARTKHLLETGIDLKACAWFYKVRCSCQRA
jgi:hypothetical protein